MIFMIFFVFFKPFKIFRDFLDFLTSWPVFAFAFSSLFSNGHGATATAASVTGWPVARRQTENTRSRKWECRPDLGGWSQPTSDRDLQQQQTSDHRQTQTLLTFLKHVDRLMKAHVNLDQIVVSISPRMVFSLSGFWLPASWWFFSSFSVNGIGNNKINNRYIQKLKALNMNCVIVVIFSPGLHKLAFIRPTKDPTWNRIHVDHLINFDDVLYYDNRFYAIDNFYRLVSVDTSDPCNLNIKLVVGKTFRTNSSNKLYLVQSYKGEFLRVERDFKWDDTLTTRRDKSENFQIGFWQAQSEGGLI